MNKHIEWLRFVIMQDKVTDSMRVKALDSLLKLQSELERVK